MFSAPASSSNQKPSGQGPFGSFGQSAGPSIFSSNKAPEKKEEPPKQLPFSQTQQPSSIFGKQNN